jgi:hypothetical protein
LRQDFEKPAVGDAAGGPARRDRTTGCLIGLVLLVLTGVAAPVIALTGYSLARDRAGIDAYDDSPVCANAPSEVRSGTCRQIVEYTVEFGAEQGGDKTAQWWLYLDTPSTTFDKIQLVSPTGVWPAQDGEKIYVTLWKGTPVSVSDGRYTSDTVNSVLQTGQGPYAWLWITSAVYVYFVLVLAVRRRPLLLLLAPLAITLVGVALYGRVVGGPWLHDPLLVLLLCVLMYGLGIAAHAIRPGRSSGKKRRGGQDRESGQTA